MAINVKRKKNGYISIIFILTLVVMVILAANVFLVSIAKIHLRSNTSLKEYTDTANTRVETIKANRGYIYDYQQNIIAQDNRTYNILCILSPDRPSEEGTIAYVKDKEYTAQVLSTLLKMDKEEILTYLNKDVYQTELGDKGRNLLKEEKEAIEEYKLPGIEFTQSVKRYYPLGVFAPYLIGFAQSDETGSTVGKMGVELYLDEELKGTDGKKIYQADKNGYILPGMKEEIINEINGNNVYLTLDKEIQEALEQSFLMTNENFEVDRIWGSVMEIDTGKILAWGQYPSFDPNTLNIDDYNNYGAQLPYEPGSTFKTFAWAAAINEGKYKDRPQVYGGPYCYSANGTTPFRVERGGYGCINNAGRKNYGWTDYDYGLIYSANSITASLVTEIIDLDTYLEYVKKFGFFSPVSTDGMKEETGVLKFTWPIEKLALSYGQGSTVTMLQMLQAYSAVFSDGTMVKPYFIDSIKDENGNIIFKHETEVVSNPISEETAKELQRILYDVVNTEEGTAKYYRIPETEIIGKTGTTELAVTGTYDSGKTIASLMSALPANDPKYIVYYAFQASYDRNAHVKSEHIKSLLRKVAMRFNVTNNNEENIQEEFVEKKEIKTYEMYDLINHSKEYSLEKLRDLNVNVIMLGEGDEVIDQFPSVGSYVTTNQNVFLLLDSTGYIMPDMTGWTRKDVIGFWDISGSGLKIDGYGKVVSQSISPGTYINRDSEIEIVLK